MNIVQTLKDGHQKTQKHEDHSKYDFWNPPHNRPQGQNLGSLRALLYTANGADSSWIRVPTQAASSMHLLSSWGTQL